MNWLILDIATAALPNAADFIEPVDSPKRRPPATYTKPDSIADWRRKDYESDLAKAGLDFDLAMITGLGLMSLHGQSISLLRSFDEESLIREAASHIQPETRIVTYNGNAFDLPMLMRRAKYLDVPFPAINIDRYKSPHVDLCAILSGGDRDKRRSLSFYARRLGMGITKVLSGAEESQVPVTGRWDDLAASIQHDVEATRRLAVWLGVISPTERS